MLTVTMAIGLFMANRRGCAAVRRLPKRSQPSRSARRCMHLLTASMKGMVALTGLEAMSNGIQFVINEDVGAGQVGQAAPAAPQVAVEFLQRQVGHRALRADLVPVLRRADDALPDLLCHPLQRL